MLKVKTRNLWSYVLHKLFDHPSIVLIGGTWKSGKTDFALYIAQTLLSLPLMGTHIIQEVASNIDTDGKFPQISDLISLRQWLYESKVRKLYIMDEASEHFPSRRAMSGKNVGFVKLIPEISKAHARMLVVGHQLLKIDSILLDEVWCRGAFIKLELKRAQLISHLLPQPYMFRNIPKTTITFDPYAIAPFTEQPEGSILFKDEEKQLLWKWSNGTPFKELGLHPMSLNRMVRKYVRNSLEKDLHPSHT